MIRDVAHSSGDPSPRDPESEIPPTPAAFAAKAKDLQALRDAVVDAAGVGVGLWLSYLFALFYLAVAVGGVTHRDLLFEYPVRLPFLNVDLPLIGFFVLGPAIFLIVHAYVLLHFALLAEKVGAFDAELQLQVSDEDTRARLRRQLPSNIFVQFLAGPHEVRTGIVGFLLRLIANISLVVGPLALLVFFELQFLPYHHEVIAWWQRLTVVLDLALLWTLWPSIMRGKTMRHGWRDLLVPKAAVWALVSLIPVLLVFAVATFPGEWLDENLPSVRLVPTTWPPWESMSGRANQTRLGWTSLHEQLVAGDIDFVARKPRSLWSNRLVLPSMDVIDHSKFDTEAKIIALPETISLRGRRLEGAVLLSARLRKVDFTASHLQGADLRGVADLRGANFGCDNSGSRSQCADLRGAKLYRAQLQGASLDYAQLQGASIEGAQLQGATLEGAQLQGASLNHAQLQGAQLDHAQLQGASLEGAQLQGALLVSTQLQGALLDRAQLQGVSLEGADLEGASLVHIFAWRADARNAKAQGARVIAPETQPKYESLDCPVYQKDPCDWSSHSFATLKHLIERQVPEGDDREMALRWIATLDPAKSLEGWQPSWADLERSSPSRNVYEVTLARLLRETGCEASSGRYVISRLLLSASFAHARFSPDSIQPAVLAAAFLDETNCSGARGLSKADKLKLQEIRDHHRAAAAASVP